MSDIVKKVNRGQDLPYKTVGPQSFTQNDAKQGDILKVKDSLGKAAGFIKIKAQGGGMSVRFNVNRTVYQYRYNESPDSINSQLTGNINTASGFDYVDQTQTPIWVDKDTALTFDHEFPVSDIELTTVSGAFEIIVM